MIQPRGKCDRASLKEQFADGSIPSAKNFGNLIESTVNIVDDCLDWSQEDGLKLRVRSSTRRLLSFFRIQHQPPDAQPGPDGATTLQNPDAQQQAPNEPDWSVSCDDSTGALHFVPVAGAPAPGAAGAGAGPGVLTLLSAGQGRGRVGIGVADPQFDLEVDGIVKSSGRIGTSGAIDANGGWHDITGPLTGCNAFEVVAGVSGAEGKGRYALLHAYALNAYNPAGFISNFFHRKNSIRCHHAWYRSRADKLNLSWRRIDSRHYALQLKSNTSFGDGFKVRYSVTRLWFEPDVSNAQAPARGASK